MPQKQIYISNDDIPVFEELQQYAQQKGESVSSVVMEAVTDFLSARREISGKEEYVIQTIEYGTWIPEPAAVKKLKFYGRLLAVSSIDQGNGDFEQWKIYHTKKGKYLFWRKYGHVQEISLELTGNERDDNAEPATEEFMHAEYFITDSMPECKGIGTVTINERVLPAKLIQDAMDSLQVEWLDV